MNRSDFDYIVVGAGSAGCALAARLSEVPSNSVLLLEGGPDNKSWKIDMPAAVSMLVSGKKYNWAYHTEPEEYIGGRKVDLARGKVLGGSSSINGMVYTRGHPLDFDEWADDYGAEGWRFKDVLNYFKKSETSERGASQYRGGLGPLHTVVPDLDKNPINRAFMNAGKQAGFAVRDDQNSDDQEGFAPSEKTVWKGRRWSSAKAYLSPEVRARKNLAIETGCIAQKILFEGKRAVGVTVKQGSGSRSFAARREIIICAGAVDSPKLLMLSGVGPAAALQKLNIPVVHDLPGVGQNLQDHPDVAVQFWCKDASVTLLKETQFPKKIFVGLQWFLNRSGAASTTPFDAAAYVRTRPGLNKPNMKFELLPLALKPDSFDPYSKPTFQVHCALMTAESRGELTLRSSNPSDAPAIKLNLLKDPIDRQSLREGVRIIRKLVSTPAFKPYTGEEIEPGKQLESDDVLDAWIDKRVTTSWHLSGTCRMGRADDPNAVVSNKLKVHGVEGLRVADASIMPVVVSANTNASSIMIGERAAGWVLNDA